MKKRYLAVSLMMLMALPLMASAQTTGDLKIGVVNVGRLLQESPQAQSAKESLEQEFAPRRREIVAMQTALDGKAAALQKDAEVMGAAEREKAERDLRNEERGILRAQNEFREDLDLRNNEAIGRIQQDVMREISGYAESGGYDLVLADGIVFANKSIDITDPILERLKASYKAGGAPAKQ